MSRGLEAVRNRQKQVLPPYGGEAEFEFAEEYYRAYLEANGFHVQGEEVTNSTQKIWALHEAIKRWEIAAEQGCAPVQNRLGWAYSYGEGVPKDYVKAHMWLSLAWEANKIQRIILYSSTTDEQRDYIEGLMTPAEIAAAKRQA